MLCCMAAFSKRGESAIYLPAICLETTGVRERFEALFNIMKVTIPEEEANYEDSENSGTVPYSLLFL